MKLTLLITILLLYSYAFSGIRATNIRAKGKVYYGTKSGQIVLDGAMLNEIRAGKEGTFPVDVKLKVKGLELLYYNKRDETKFSFNIGGREVTVGSGSLKLSDGINYIYLDFILDTIKVSTKEINKEDIPLVIFEVSGGRVVKTHRIDKNFLKRLLTSGGR